MSAFIFVNKSRMDLQCQLKDADAVLKVFDECGIHFDRKFTSLHGDQPSTITFVGLRSDTKANIAMMVSLITFQCSHDRINNVYLLMNNGRTYTRKHFEETQVTDA